MQPIVPATQIWRLRIRNKSFMKCCSSCILQYLLAPIGKFGVLHLAVPSDWPHPYTRHHFKSSKTKKIVLLLIMMTTMMMMMMIMMLMMMTVVIVVMVMMMVVMVVIVMVMMNSIVRQLQQANTKSL